jgi:hypothetical protein
MLMTLIPKNGPRLHILIDSRNLFGLNEGDNIIKLLLLIAMIFLHIVDDYYLQGWLASAKQKSYWEQNAPDEMYKNDYKMVLFMHSFSWSFMIMLVPTIYILLNTTSINVDVFGIVLFFIINLIIHMVTDNMKANQKEINLIQDQLIHLTQIIGTWLFAIVLF